MAKQKSIWFCSECGNKQTKWTGQCLQCDQWNTFQEEIEHSNFQRFEAQAAKTSRPLKLSEVKIGDTPRIRTQIGECDRLIGGGIVPGSLTLVGGDPGIGKSTLMLQLSNALAVQGLLVLYVCGEESVEQTSMRAKRLAINTDNLLLLSETNLSASNPHIDQLSPDVVIVDSIQIVYKSEITSSLRIGLASAGSAPRNSCTSPKDATSPHF